jgi:putative ABC transport system permease protein
MRIGLAGPVRALAWRNLVVDRMRFALSVAGVAVSVMLMLLLRGYLDGVYQQASAYFENAAGEIVVAQSGTRNTLSSASVLPDGTRGRARSTTGVTRAIPVLFTYVILELHERKQFAFAVGYDPALGGGPWTMAAGREPRADGEIVLDRLLAREHEIAVGDRIELLGQQMVVVGLADGTTFWIGTYAFLTKSALEGLVRSPGATSFLFVTPGPGVDPEALRQRLGELPGVTALARAEIIDNQRRVLGRIYDGPLGLMVAIAFLVGVLVVGLITYSATVERRHEYGVLKAIGGGNLVLYGVVAAQALVAAVTGALLGVAMGLGASALLEAIRPQFNIAIEPWAVGAALAASLLMAMLGSLIPARAIARLAPSEVFRS